VALEIKFYYFSVGLFISTNIPAVYRSFIE